MRRSTKLHTALAAVWVVALSGCTSTVAGQPVRAGGSGDADGVDVALLDTGIYPVVPGRVFGTAGSDLLLRSLLEGTRMAEFVVGPWEVDETFRYRPGILHTSVTGLVPNADFMLRNAVLPAPLPDIAAAHGFITGFSTLRVAEVGHGPINGLQNVVLRFPDATAAAAAAAEMAAKDPPPSGAPPGRPVRIGDHPEAIAAAYDLPGGSTAVHSFNAHGPYVLYQYAATPDDAVFGATADLLVTSCLSIQKKRIDQFTPTDPAKLADLPMDPTGQLMAHTLWDKGGFALNGAWQPRAWLHFEDDPLAANAWFDAAGVDVVAQKLSTVYRAASADGARKLADHIVRALGAAADVTADTGVPGLPTAQCFERTSGGLPRDAAQTWQFVQWRYKCVARTDRYTFTAFSAEEGDVKQQISAQYRVLAGK